MGSPYKYTRLDLGKDAIRLVRILKGVDGPIECEISETYLNNAEDVSYEALSYVWGNKESAEKIQVDGCQFTVTENLFEALSNLRQPEEDRILWIDAICIDQSHVDERNHQVGQMCRIYQNARNVIIWLGASNEDIDGFLHCMQTPDTRRSIVQSTLADRHNERRLRRRRLPSGLDERQKIVTRFREKTKHQKRCCLQLLEREWFSRIWVVQEAALAKTATLVCGGQSVDSDWFVTKTESLGLFWHCNENVRSRLQILPGSRRKRSWWSTGPESQDLRTLIQKFAKSKAKDPRDMIYALLGLSKDAFTSTILRPDYQLSQQEVIQRTVAHILIQSGHISGSSRHTDMPTWDLDKFLTALEDLPHQVQCWRISHGTNVDDVYSQRWKMQHWSATPDTHPGTNWTDTTIEGDSYEILPEFQKWKQQVLDFN